MFGSPAGRDEQMRAGDPLAVGEPHRDAGPLARRPSRIADPRAKHDAFRGQALGQEARPARDRRAAASGPRSSTVTRAPSRRCACAISIPIGAAADHDQMLAATRGWRRSSRWSDTARWSSPGIGGIDRTRAGRDRQTAAAGFRHRRRAPCAGSVKRASARSTVTPSPSKRSTESLGAMSAIDPLDAVADRGEIDPRRRISDAEAPRRGARDPRAGPRRAATLTARSRN